MRCPRAAACQLDKPSDALASIKPCVRPTQLNNAEEKSYTSIIITASVPVEEGLCIVIE